jgi:ATP-binding cassette subfamily F protein 3
MRILAGLEEPDEGIVAHTSPGLRIGYLPQGTDFHPDQTLRAARGTVRLGQTVKLGYMAQEQELLDPSLSALETIQRVASFNETQARHFLHFFLFSGDDPLRPSGELSFGERARLQLALLVAQGCTFLLLDESFNRLDIPSRGRFEQALTQFNGSILAVVYDRYFIERFASDIWTIEDGKIEKLM